MNKLLLLVFWAPVFAFGGMASANVSLKNGNFFIAYSDLVLPGGFETKIERAYNSKSAYTGMFGPGWSSEYEAYLTVSPDGSVVAHEYGGGVENRFKPVTPNSKDLDQSVQMILQAAQKAGILGSAKTADDYRKRLRGDDSFRNGEWERFVRAGKLKSRVLPTGTKLYSRLFTMQYLIKDADGYSRYYEGGKVEKYNESGRLVLANDKNKNFIKLTYGKDGKLATLEDNFTRKLIFDFNRLGFAEKIQINGGKAATYEYNSIGELVYSKDTDGNVYTYKYSDPVKKEHNLIEVGYSDKTSMQITYYGPEKCGSTKKVKNRDGSAVDYVYQFSGGCQANGGHRVVNSVETDTAGKKVTEKKYEYFLDVRPADGSEWTKRMIATIDGDTTDTAYNECCGLPVSIRRGKEQTQFQYDNSGRVVRKTTPSEITVLGYDQKAGKVSKVQRLSRNGSKVLDWSEFKYDEKGNLNSARNSNRKTVQLYYDSYGRIKTLLDQDKRRLEFKYNEQSKPIEITDPSVGTITVSYTNSGEIKKVDSSAGKKVVLQLTTAFQNLVDIIRPAGVTLSF